MPLGYTSYATKLIIAKGLSCKRQGQITGPRFNLFVEPPPPRPNRAFGAGPYPGAAWNVVDDINKFYKPADAKVSAKAQEQPFYQVPIEDEKKYLESRNVNVIMKARIGDKEYEKIYSIKEQYAPIAVTISNFANKSYNNISVVIENIRRVGKKAKIIIENFRPKK